MTTAPSSESGQNATRERWYERSPGVPLDRFPVLGDALAAAAKLWTDSFCALSASPGEIGFRSLRATTAGELIRPEDNTPVLASLRLPGCMGTLVLGRSLIVAFVEALFGGEGDGEGASTRRPVSPVEMRMVDVIGGQAATALTAGFRDYAPTRFEFDRARAYPDTRFLGKPNVPMLAAGFDLKAIGRTIPFQVALPLNLIEANATVWAGSPATAPLMDDTLWAEQLRAEVVRATMALKASVAMGPVTLGAVAGWRVGDTLELPPASDSNVLLLCENETLFRCDLGQAAGMYTVRIGDWVSDRDPPPRKDG